MKILVTDPFKYEGTEHEKGDTPDLPESVAKSAIKKGRAEKLKKDDTPEIEELGETSGEGSDGGGNAPVWSRKYWVGEDTNLQLNIWDRGDFYGGELTRSTRENGEWEQDGRVFLPNSKTLLEMAENLKEMFFKHKELRTE